MSTIFWVKKFFRLTKVWIKQNFGPQLIGTKNLVKIGSVTELKYSWYGQMLQGQMLPWQMSLWQLASVKDGCRSLHLKFGKNPVSNSWDIPDMDKCYKNKYCQDKCHHYSWSWVGVLTKNKGPFIVHFKHRDYPYV